jgi:outer membrane biosynthesis protein TonB
VTVYVDGNDHQASIAFTPRRPGPLAVAVGVGTALVAHAIPVAMMLLLGTGAAASALVDARDDKDEEVIPVDFIPAEFVKRGREFEANKLPNRRLPQKSTRQHIPDPAQAGGNAPPEEVPDAGPQPTEAEIDDLARLAERAGAFAPQIPMDQEGDPDGVEGGTAERGEADIYPGRLYNFFRRGWTGFQIIPDAELRGLRMQVRIRITADGRMGGWDVLRSSGNPVFDQSVENRLRDAENGQLPEVPAEEAEKYLGHSVAIQFSPPRRLAGSSSGAASSTETEE